MIDKTIQYLLLILYMYIIITKAIPIDNGIEGTPTISCSDDTISLKMTTQQSYHGRMFVKGMSEFPECEQDYSRIPPRLQSDTKNIQMVIQLGTCNMMRQRVLNPPGLSQSITVVVSFHPVFLTKVDRAFNIKCFYMTEAHPFTANIQVSMITTERIDITRQVVPTCTYTIHKDTPDGPLVRFSVIGQKLYHVWKCEKSEDLGILIRNCVIDGGGGNQFQSLDDIGCPIDRHVMPHLTYDPDLLSAFVETHAFKFADTPNLRFQCEIAICSKVPVINPNVGESTCRGVTPPACNGRAVLGKAVNASGYNLPIRRRRQALTGRGSIPRTPQRQNESIIDVASENDIMVIFDTQENLIKEQLGTNVWQQTTCKNTERVNLFLALSTGMLGVLFSFCCIITIVLYRRRKYLV